MILVDMSQISLASMMMHLNMNKTTKPDEAMVRHMILNSLRMYRSKFKQELEKTYKNVSCILSRENLGMGCGNNLGIKKAKLI